MSSRKRHLVLLILQFLAEENFEKTLHILERESGVFLSLTYIVDTARRGEWDEIDDYLKAFVQCNDNDYTRKLFLGIRVQKYLQALSERDNAKAVDILRKELRVFSHSYPDVFRKLTMSLSADDFRDNEAAEDFYACTESSRDQFAEELKQMVISCPGLREKIRFPILECSRLYKLIEQSLWWQHRTCKISIPMTPIETLMVDHICTDQPPSNATEAPPLFSAEIERN